MNTGEAWSGGIFQGMVEVLRWAGREEEGVYAIEGERVGDFEDDIHGEDARSRLALSQHSGMFDVGVEELE